MLSHAILCLSLGIGKGFLIKHLLLPKITKKSYGFILFGTINEDDAQLDACCCFSTPSIQNLSTFLVRVSCVSLTLGKLGHGVLFIPFIKRRPAYFSSHLRCCQKTAHITQRSYSNFFEGLHLDAWICHWQLTGDLFFVFGVYCLSFMFSVCAYRLLS